jgi:hypothetical protein
MHKVIIGSELHRFGQPHYHDLCIMLSNFAMRSVDYDKFSKITHTVKKL